MERVLWRWTKDMAGVDATNPSQESWPLQKKRQKEGSGRRCSHLALYILLVYMYS